MNIIDENYLPLHDHKLIAGRNFISKAETVEETEVIVNEAILKRFNIAGQNAPQESVRFSLLIARSLRSLGVIKDFEYGRANSKSPNNVIMRYSAHDAGYLNVKIVSTDLPETYAKIESIWKEIDNVHVG